MVDTKEEGDNFPKDRFTSERIQKSINKLMLGAPESKDHDSKRMRNLVGKDMNQKRETREGKGVIVFEILV